MMIKYKDGSACCDSCCGACGQCSQCFGSSDCGARGVCGCGFCCFCFCCFRFSSCVGLCAGDSGSGIVGSAGRRIALSHSREFCTGPCVASCWFAGRVDLECAVLHRSQRPHQSRLSFGRLRSTDPTANQCGISQRIRCWRSWQGH